MLDGYVGLSLVNQKGNTNTIKRKTGEKCHRVPYYEITCSVCSKDKELFTSPFLQTYGKFKSGKCCCGCSKSHVYTETQNKLRVKRVCKAKGLEFLGWSGVYSG